MDRTKEFEGLIQLFSASKEAIPPATIVVTDFSEAVTAISERFEQPKRRIEKITVLVDQRALYYNAPGAEIDEVVKMFGNEIGDLEHQLKLLESWLERNTTRFSQRRSHGDNVVGELKRRVGVMKNAMQEALKKRIDVMKAKARQQSQFGVGNMQRRRGLELGSPLFNFAQAPHALQPPDVPQPAHEAPGSDSTAPVSAALPLKAETAPLHQSQSTVRPPRAAVQPQVVKTTATSQVYTGPSGVRRRPRAGQSLMTRLIEEEQQSAADQELENAHKRLSTARGVEREIEKLGEVFQRFSALVVDQGESLRVIDADIEAASMEVDEGHQSVVKTYGITKGNRSIIIKVFATVLVVGMLLIVTN